MQESRVHAMVKIAHQKYHHGEAIGFEYGRDTGAFFARRVEEKAGASNTKHLLACGMASEPAERGPSRGQIEVSCISSSCPSDLPARHPDYVNARHSMAGACSIYPEYERKGIEQWQPIW